MNEILFPENVYIDTNNIPKSFLTDEQSFNDYLSKYYSKYFHSQLYDYKKFCKFKKITIGNHSNNNVEYENSIVYNV